MAVDKCAGLVEKTGFRPSTADLTAASEARITLAIASPLESVVVSANRTETTPEQAVVSASVITEQDSKRANFRCSSMFCARFPACKSTNTAPLEPSPKSYTRGADYTGTLVLLDGVPLNDPGGELHLENFSTEGLDRVEVVRGPESALFGAEAAAGVIQLFTKHGNPEDKRSAWLGFL